MIEEEIQLIIGGKILTGWKSLRIGRALGSLCGDFSFSLIDFPISSTKNIIPGETVVIKIDRALLPEKIMTGIVDKVGRKKDSESTLLSFSGRDVTADLIDCSAIYKTSMWRRKKLSEIIKDLVEPFDIVTTLAIDEDPKIKEFGIQSGETVFAAIERLCSAYSILPYTDELGRLTLAEIASEKTNVGLEVGKNIISLSVEEDFTNRFSSYKAKGQGRNSSGWSKGVVGIKARSIDTDVDRYRPLVFCVEKKMTQDEIQKRVNWEAQVRAGRAVKCDITVLGWSKDPTSEVSTPWKINELVNIKDKNWNIDSEMLVSAVSFSLDDTSGRVTELELSPPETFRAAPGERIQLSRRSYVRPS